MFKSRLLACIRRPLTHNLGVSIGRLAFWQIRNNRIKVCRGLELTFPRGTRKDALLFTQAFSDCFICLFTPDILTIEQAFSRKNHSQKFLIFMVGGLQMCECVTLGDSEKMITSVPSWHVWAFREALYKSSATEVEASHARVHCLLNRFHFGPFTLFISWADRTSIFKKWSA